ncbi:MAG: hypothetical protein ACK5C3_09020 [bacterium]
MAQAEGQSLAALRGLRDDGQQCGVARTTHDSKEEIDERRVFAHRGVDEEVRLEIDVNRQRALSPALSPKPHGER